MIDIIYKDEDICVCIKPRGILSEGEGASSLPSALREQLGADSVLPVHRLDKETQGLMVYALSKRAAAELSAQIVDGRLVKEYIATLCGVPREPEGELCDLLYYDRARGKAFVVTRQRRGVRPARLYYRVLSAEGDTCKIRVRLFTGRTHQIRVQFASRGLPLLGDRRYGAPKSEGGLALLSCYLSFEHPVSGEKMEFEI